MPLGNNAIVLSVCRIGSSTRTGSYISPQSRNPNLLKTGRRFLEMLWYFLVKVVQKGRYKQLKVF